MPSQTSHQPITIEKAIAKVEGDDITSDSYLVTRFYMISNILAVVVFMVFLSPTLVFSTPRLYCTNEEGLEFRCSVTEACARHGGAYRIDGKHSVSNFIADNDLICSQILNERPVLSVIFGMAIIGLLTTGILSDRLGRKKII